MVQLIRNLAFQPNPDADKPKDEDKDKKKKKKRKKGKKGNKKPKPNDSSSSTSPIDADGDSTLATGSEPSNSTTDNLPTVTGTSWTPAPSDTVTQTSERPKNSNGKGSANTGSKGRKTAPKGEGQTGLIQIKEWNLPTEKPIDYLTSFIGSRDVNIEANSTEAALAQLSDIFGIDLSQNQRRELADRSAEFDLLGKLKKIEPISTWANISSVDSYIPTEFVLADAKDIDYDLSKNEISENEGRSEGKVPLTATGVDMRVSRPRFPKGSLHLKTVNIFPRTRLSTQSKLLLPYGWKYIDKEKNDSSDTGMEPFVFVPIDTTKVGHSIWLNTKDGKTFNTIDMSLNRNDTNGGNPLKFDKTLDEYERAKILSIKTISTALKTKVSEDANERLGLLRDDNAAAAVMNGMPTLKTFLVYMVWLFSVSHGLAKEYALLVAKPLRVLNHIKRSANAYEELLLDFNQYLYTLPAQCPIDVNLLNRLKKASMPYLTKERASKWDEYNLLEVPVLVIGHYWDGKVDPSTLADNLVDDASEIGTKMIKRIKSHLAQAPLSMPLGDWFLMFFRNWLGSKTALAEQEFDVRFNTPALNTKEAKGNWIKDTNHLMGFSTWMTGFMDALGSIGKQFWESFQYNCNSTVRFWEIFARLTDNYKGTIYSVDQKHVYDRVDVTKDFYNNQMTISFDKEKMYKSFHRMIIEKLGTAKAPYLQINSYAGFRMRNGEYKPEKLTEKTDCMPNIMIPSYINGCPLNAPVSVDEILSVNPIIWWTENVSRNNVQTAIATWKYMDDKEDFSILDLYKMGKFWDDQEHFVPVGTDKGDVKLHSELFLMVTDDPEDFKFHTSEKKGITTKRQCQYYITYFDSDPRRVPSVIKIGVRKIYYKHTDLKGKKAVMEWNSESYEKIGIPWYNDVQNTAADSGAIGDMYEKIQMLVGFPTIREFDGQDQHSRRLTSKLFNRYIKHAVDYDLTSIITAKYKEFSDKVLELQKIVNKSVSRV